MALTVEEKTEIITTNLNNLFEQLRKEDYKQGKIFEVHGLV